MRAPTLAGTVLSLLAFACAGCGSGSDDEVAKDRAALISAASGVPQNANVLGNKEAEYTFGMYVSPTSYRMVSRVLPQVPELIRARVKAGQLNIRVRTLGGAAFGDDDDSLRASRLITAAGLQSKFWPAFVSMAYSYTGSLDQFSEQDILKDAGLRSIRQAQTDADDPRVVKSVNRNDSIASTAGSKDYRDVYVVSNRKGVQVDVTQQVQSGRLLNAVANAEKIIAG